jgi:UDP-3-O-[3-hydroxymyristoyl] glucosamine N-acyltransferase
MAHSRDAVDNNGYDLGHGVFEKAVRHRNPDGTIGGWVPSEFDNPRATIGPDVIVFPGVIVTEGATILGPCIIKPE